MLVPRARRESPVLLIISLVVAVLASLAPSTSVHAAEKVKLRLHLKAGETYPMSMSAEQAITQTVNGNEQKIDQTMGFDISFKVASVDASDGTIHGAFTYDAVRIKMQMPGMTVDYDSSKKPAEGDAAPAPANDPKSAMTKVFSALVGQSLEVAMTPTGRVKELKGADKLLDSVVRSMDLPEQARQTIKQQMKSQFGDDALKRSFEQMTAIYPEKEVGVGDTWDATQKIALGVALEVKSTYALKSLADGKVSIGVDGVIDTPEKKDAPAGDDAAAAPAPPPGAPVTKLKGKQSGTMTLDQETGWVAGADITQDLTGSISVSKPDGQTVEIPLTIKSQVHMGRGEQAAK